MSQVDKPIDTYTDQKMLTLVDRRTGGGLQAWASAVVAVALILTTGYVVLRIGAIPGAVVGKAGVVLKDMLKPTINIEQVIANTIGELKKESKLVVLTVEITVREKRSSTKRTLWDTLSLGETIVEVLVTGNKVQYIVPTAVISKDTFRWDASRGEVTIDIPCPVLDEDIVEIQSDPAHIEVRKDIGWGRLESRSGAFLEQQIRRDLRSHVIREGNNELLIERARRNAEQAIRDIFGQFMKKEKVEVPVRVSIN